jgi:uncharacterized protein (DUF39 family)
MVEPPDNEWIDVIRRGTTGMAGSSVVLLNYSIDEGPRGLNECYGIRLVSGLSLTIV